MCSPPVCKESQRLVCGQGDGCPNGCGYACKYDDSASNPPSGSSGNNSGTVMCSAPVCKGSQRLVCGQGDGCPNGCGYTCKERGSASKPPSGSSGNNSGTVMCSLPVCKGSQRLVCGQGDGCPNGCGFECKEPVQMCMPPVCAAPKQLVCDREDRCPYGCGLSCRESGPPEPGTQPSNPGATSLIMLPPVELLEPKHSVNLTSIEPLLKNGEVIETEILDENLKSYAGALTDFYLTVDSLCHVGTLSKSMALVQHCPAGSGAETGPTELVQQWDSAIEDLIAVARGTSPSSKAVLVLDSSVNTNEQPVYLLQDGSSLIPIRIDEITALVRGEKTKTPLAPLPLKLESCPVPQRATGRRISELCRDALPVPPISIESSKSSLTLKPATKNEANVFVKLSLRGKGEERGEPVALLPVRVPPQK